MPPLFMAREYAHFVAAVARFARHLFDGARHDGQRMPPLILS